MEHTSIILSVFSFSKNKIEKVMDAQLKQSCILTGEANKA